MPRMEQKAHTHERILRAAGQGFRAAGFGGAGVDGLAKAAGVTSGAFYTHFKSKSAAFVAAVEAGLAELEQGVRMFQDQSPEDWWAAFVRFYLGERRVCALEQSCALQSLSMDVARAGDVAAQSFQRGLQAVVQQMLRGPGAPGAPETPEACYAALGSLIGAVSLARAVPDAGMAEAIAQATCNHLLKSGQP